MDKTNIKKQGSSKKLLDQEKTKNKQGEGRIGIKCQF